MKYSQTMKLDRSSRNMTKKEMINFFNRSTVQFHRRIEALLGLQKEGPRKERRL